MCRLSQFLLEYGWNLIMTKTRKAMTKINNSDKLNNVDRTETEKFSKLADSWWDLDGPSKPLHAINKPRLQFIHEYTDIQNKKVLDVGCGAGILTESLYKKGANITGIDASPEVIDAAIKHASKNDLKIYNFKKTKSLLRLWNRLSIKQFIIWWNFKKWLTKTFCYNRFGR